MKRLHLWILLAGIGPLFPILATGAFTVSGRDILLDGADFEVRGICYQPAQIGEDPSASPPYGDYYTIEYQDRYRRDFENIRKMGANVVRIYGWAIGANHSDFLNRAYNEGNQSLYILVNRYINPETNWSDTGDVSALVADWEAIASEIKDEPAVMGLLIGNEVNMQNGNGYNQDFWNAMNLIAGAVKAIAPDKLVAVAITDALDQVNAQDSMMSHFDFWGIQVYRGYSFSPFFSDYAIRSGKPLIITEFGYDAYDASSGSEFANEASLPADAMENLVSELQSNASIVTGACVFEYADEWWKAGNPFTHDAPTGWSGPFADGEGNEEWWGIFRVADDGSNIDRLEPRAMFYRLAAMWNPSALIALQTGLAGTNLQVSFSYPVQLRDQYLEVELSTDLDSWSLVASNAYSTYLSSYKPTVAISSVEAGEILLVTLTYDPTATGPVNLVVNGGFESGNSAGWQTFSTVSSAQAEAGTYSLVLAAPGGYAVPLAYQTIPAAPGDEFNLSGYLYTSVPLPTGTTHGLFKIVFEDALGNDLQPASVSLGTLAAAPYYGAESTPSLNAASPVGTWVLSQAQAVAPANTVSVSFFALNVDEFANTMYIDSVQAVQVNAPVSPPASRVFFRVNN